MVTKLSGKKKERKEVRRRRFMSKVRKRKGSGKTGIRMVISNERGIFLTLIMLNGRSAGSHIERCL